MSDIKLELLHNIELDGYINDSKISPSGGFAVVAIAYEAILKVDLSTGVCSEVMSFRGDEVIGLSFSKDGFYLYVMLGSGFVAEIVTSRWVENSRIKVASKFTYGEILVGESRHYIYTLGSDDNMSEVDFQMGEVARVCAVNNYGQNFSLSPDSKVAYFGRSSYLMALDLQSWKLETVPVGPFLDVFAVAIDPAGSRAYVGSRFGEVGFRAIDLITNDYIFGVRGVGVRYLAIDSKDSLAFIVGDDGDKLPRAIYVYAVRGEVMRLLKLEMDDAKKIVVAPDDRYVCVNADQFFRVFELLQ